MLGTTESVLDSLRRRVDAHGDRLAYSFLVDGGPDHVDLTYGALDAAARRWGGVLRERTAPGDRVLLVHPAGLDFITAFLGCLYAGVIPVPIRPPGGRGRLDGHLRRLGAVIDDATPAIGLTTLGSAAALRGIPGHQQAGLGWLTDVDLHPAGSTPDVTAFPPAAAEDLAFLQYTSGSTREPVGVAVRHRDLMTQLEFYRQRSDQTDDMVMVGWLPHHHDYGLIGFLLASLHMGVPYHFMSSEAFISRPSRWLAALTRLRGTHTGGPTFAYGLCVTIPPGDRDGIDLTSLRVMSVGGDPVNALTMDAFIAAFEPLGLDPCAVRPGYGLAEAVLSVASPEPGTPLASAFDRESLTRAIALPSRRGSRLVALGTTMPGQELLVVDPQSREPLPDGRIGEVWLRGGSIAAGYWGRPEQSIAVFGARLAGGADIPHLRTGDLGFRLDGQLFITGRLKDSIVVRGRNHAPQDIEWTVQGADPLFRRDGGAAFLIDSGDGEALVVVQEWQGDLDADLAVLADRVRTAVARDHGLTLRTVELIPPGTLPRTTSGKVRHHACRAAFRDGGFAGSRRLDLNPGPSEVSPAHLESSDAELGDGVVIAVLAIVRTALNRPGLGAHDNLYGQGLDSLRSLIIRATLVDTFAVQLPPNEPFDHPSVVGLAARVRAARAAQNAAGDGEQSQAATTGTAGPGTAGPSEGDPPVEAGAPVTAGQIEGLSALLLEQTRLLADIRDRLAGDGS